MHSNLFLALILTLALAACSPSAPDFAAAIRAVMDAQQTAWNRGDIDSFMDGYERGETTTFVSGNDVTRGWQTVLDRYKQRYSTKEQMGTLAFSDLQVQSLGPDIALAD